MPTANECIRALENAAGGDLSNDEILALLEELERIKKERGARAGVESVEAEMFDAAEELVADLALAARIAKRNTYRNMIIRSRLLQSSDEAFEKLGDASLAIEAALVGINGNLNGGRKSADSLGKAILGETLGGMLADLRRGNLHGVYASGVHDRDIAKELWDLSKAKPTGAATKNQQAKAIAKIINKYKLDMVRRENRAGAHIRLLDGHVARQTHSRDRMRKAGQKAWKDEVRGKLDWERMGVVPEEQEKFLDAAYNALITGVRKQARGEEESDTLFHFKGPGNLAKRESAHRVMLFKSADEWFDYNEKFGYGDLRETLLQDFQRAAMNTGLMEMFGTNPQAMLSDVRQRIERKYRDIDTRSADRVQQKRLDNMMKEVDGSINNADVASAAAISRIFRSLISMAKLGGAVISAAADLAMVMSERKWQGRTWAQSFGDGFQAAIEVFPVGSQERKRVGELIGVAIDGMMGDTIARFSAQDDAPGKMNKMMRIFFKANLLGPLTDSIKRSVGIMMSRDLAMWAEGAFDTLPERVQTNLRRYGIDADKWEIARQALHTENGKTFMIPSLVDELDIPKKRKDEVREALSTYITDRVEFASPTPGARERAIMRRGNRPGTPEGEALRFVTQFKAFPITVTSKVLGRELFSGEARTLSDALLRGQGDLLGLANVIAGSTVLGMAAYQAKEVAKGREPRDWNDPSLLFAGMMQGGGMGIYGDFLFGETNRFGRSALGTAAGPFFGSIDELIAIKDAAMAGEDVWAETINATKSNVPFANLFYLKPVLDYMVWYQLQEWANPGYLRRMERRMLRENNQRYSLPFGMASPAQAIPFGGGGRVAEGFR